MKIALVHDYIKEYGGAERVLEALHEMWPEAPVFTTVYLPNFLGPHKERFKNWDIRTSFLQYIPFKEKLISPFRLVAPWVFRQFDFSEFDVVIVSATGAYSPNILNTKYEIHNTLHVSYCHTPPRYLYGFATARNWKKSIILHSIGLIANHFLRLIDFKSAQNVGYFIANSKNVKGRIKKFYRREAEVIYPPVEMALRSLRQFDASSNPILPQSEILARAKPSKSSSQDALFKSSSHAKAPRADSYFLAGGRIARPKHIDLIIKTFEKLELPLKVFGRSFGGHDSLFMIHNSNIEFVEEVTDEEKLELMRNAKAYIFASEDEDFGITPVEAMAVGTPVIAYRSGGVVESVVDPSTNSGRFATGIFFDELTVGSLTKTIKQFNRVKRDNAINPNDCIKQAQKFSKERFKKEIKEFVESKIKS